MKFEVGEFYKESLKYFSFNFDQTILMTTLHEDRYLYLWLSHMELSEYLLKWKRFKQKM
jgi:hypothetical protein